MVVCNSLRSFSSFDRTSEFVFESNALEFLELDIAFPHEYLNGITNQFETVNEK